MSQQTAMAPPATGPATSPAVRAVHEGGTLAVAGAVADIARRDGAVAT